MDPLVPMCRMGPMGSHELLGAYVFQGLLRTTTQILRSGTRARLARVRAASPNQLDCSEECPGDCSDTVRCKPRMKMRTRTLAEEPAMESHGIADSRGNWETIAKLRDQELNPGLLRDRQK
jgi:hypothetical protein